MFSVSRWAGGDESIRSPETRHGRVGPEGYWLDNDSAVKEAGPVRVGFTVGGACWALSY
jgi:hypothetical protein